MVPVAYRKIPRGFILNRPPRDRGLGRRRACSQSISEKSNQPIANQCGDPRNSEIGGSENVAESPHQSTLPPHARALKFAHQEIGIEQEDDESCFYHRSPDTLPHGVSVCLTAARGPR